MKRIGVATAVATLFAVSIVGYQMRKVDYVATASASRAFELDCDFAKFRQIMIRKSATKAIVNHGGMTLLSEEILRVKVDTSKDDRPILNAIRGESKTDLQATKMLTVKLNDAGVDVDRLKLRQEVAVEADGMAVRTAAVGPQQAVLDYVTTLSATPKSDTTHVELRTEMKIQVRVPRLFTHRADMGVADAAAAGLRDQQAAITELVAKHANDVLILPDIKGLETTIKQEAVRTGLQ